jgi:serine phosphatase RsbU (regulator of sigma subunit)
MPFLPAKPALRSTLVLGVGLAVITVLGIFDRASGQDLSFVLFYLLPVFLVAWFAGRTSGLIAAGAAAAAWYAADWLPQAWNWRIGWNVAEKLTFFALFAGLTARLKRSAVEVYEHELDIARDVQRALFPTVLPQIPGVEIAARLIPNRALSGDYYDVFPEPRGLALLVADVMGKGLPASLLTANLHALLHFAENEPAPPATPALLQAIHVHLRRHSPGRYLTLAWIAVARDAPELTYAVAGHPPPLLWDGAQLQRLDSTGPPLGLLPVSAWTEESVRFAPGALLVAYTDGVSEALDPAGREYGVERLPQLVERLGRAGAGAEATIQALLADLRDWTDGAEWADDVAVVAMRRTSGSR